ncbi:MAG: glutamine amidotransferase [Candidatus Neomarinimicrobiota bacterium]
MNDVSTIKQIQSPETGSRILYCGDDDLDRAAVYLSSILFDQKYAFDYISSTSAFPCNMDLNRYRLIILSDYPRANFTNSQLFEICEWVNAGGSLLMIGGWESFTGMKREYTDSPLEMVLPVILSRNDDRVNYSQGIVVLPGKPNHPIVQPLDWQKPAIIGGFNRFVPKEGTEMILAGKRIRIENQSTLSFTADVDNIPLLVVGKSGNGKVGALAFDLAPHWVSGFVDWGESRVRVDFNNNFIEVGDQYYQFVSSLISWFI